MDETTQGTEQLHRVKRGPKPKVAAIESVSTIDAKAQEYALRVWSGQSIDVAVIERVSRIANALKAQGLSLNIELPHEDAGRYLNAHK